ncbi:MAG: hypothetical protein ACK56I_07290, partial [bacterium]
MHRPPRLLEEAVVEHAGEAVGEAGKVGVEGPQHPQEDLGFALDPLQGRAQVDPVACGPLGQAVGQ